MRPIRADFIFFSSSLFWSVSWERLGSVYFKSARASGVCMLAHETNGHLFKNGKNPLDSLPWFFLPSTHSFSTSVWMLADLSPTQKVDRTRSPTKRTLPACLWTNRPRWKRCHWSLVRSHKAALLPDALPCIHKNKRENKVSQQKNKTHKGSSP